MRHVLCLALADFRQSLRDRSALLWMFILPLVFSVVFGLFMGGRGDPSNTKVRLCVADEDRSSLSRELIEELRGGGLEVLPLEAAEATAGEKKIRSLHIPEGFEASVLAGRQVRLLLDVDSDASSEATLVAKARIFRAITRLLGRRIRQETPFRDEVPPVRLESRFAGRSTMIPTGFSQSFPGNAIMFVMLVALSWGASSLSRERESGMLRRIATAPLSNAEIVLGKISGRFLTASLQVSFLVLAMYIGRRAGLFEIGGNMLSVWLILLVYALCVAPLGVAFGAFFRDPGRASSLGVLTTMTLAALGGCWWPLGIVSGPLKTLAFFTPTAWTMNAVQGIISFGHPLAAILPDLGVVLLFSAAFTLLAVRSLRVED